MAAIVTEDGNWSNDRLMGQTFNIQRALVPWSLEQRDVQQWESGGRGLEGGGGGRSFSAQGSGGYNWTRKGGGTVKRVEWNLSECKKGDFH